MNISRRVQNRIKKYKPKNGLNFVAMFLLDIGEVFHRGVIKHSEGVALLAEDVAIVIGKDPKATFFAGLFHDAGKIILPFPLYDGHNIDADEYALVKKHAVAGFKVFIKRYPFTGLCAGLHHNMYKRGYGVNMEDFPKEWSLATIKKVLEISMIISICDFINAATTRNTKIKDGSDKGGSTLKDMLYAKYPEDKSTVDIALRENEKYLAKK